MYFAFVTKKKLIKTLCLCIAIIVSISCILGLGINYVFSGNSKRELPIYRVDRLDKVLAISFDCAWGTDYTDKLLEIMQEREVKCTFFAVEFWTTKNAEYIKRISDFGHEIGTHSSTHPYMSKLSKENIVKELSTSVNAIESITGKKVSVFRPPYGDYNNLVIQTAKEMGLYSIQWDVDSLDWKNLSANEIENRVISKVKNGSIVLFHNQGLHTCEALPIIIDTLMKKGYSFMRIGDMIYKQNYKMASDGTQIINS